MLQHHLPAPEISPSEEFIVYANGEKIFVRQDPRVSYDTVDMDGHLYRTVHDRPAFALLTSDESIHFEIRCRRSFQNVVVRPASAGARCKVTDGIIEIDIDGPQKLSVELDGNLHDPLYLLVSPPLKHIPDRNAPNVHWFAGGRIHDIGKLTLHSNETVYIEDGAVVNGSIVAENAENIRIAGHGVLTDRPELGPRALSISLKYCKNVTVEGVTLLYSHWPSWQLVPFNCDHVQIRDVNIITHAPSGDGIDLVGCQHVRVSDCFIKTNDDCVAIKSTSQSRRNVRDILVENCVCWSATHGNGCEIGYELVCEEVSQIIFRHIDLIHCQYEGYQSGGALTIHNGDCATVHDVLFEDIRIEDAQEKLIDIKVLKAIWSSEEKRGKVQNITFRNIQIIDGHMPPSIIRGFESKESIFRIEYEGTDADRHFFVRRDLRGEGCVSDIIIDGLFDHGKRLDNVSDAKMIVEIATNIHFLPQKEE